MSASRPVVHVLTPGVSLDAAALVQGLAEKGWDAHVVCDRASATSLQRLELLPPELALRAVHPPPPGLHAARRSETRRLLARLLRVFVRHPVAIVSGLRSRGAPGPGWFWARYEPAVVAALRPGIVHFHSTAAARLRAGMARGLGARVVVSVSDAELAAVYLGGSPPPEIMSTADALVVSSTAIGRHAVRRGLPAGDHAMLPTPDAGRGTRSSRNGESLRILSIGELTWRNGYEYGIHAIRLLLDRGLDCRYRIVGDGSHLGALRFARWQLGLEDRVELVGSLGTPELGRQLEWADVVLDPSVADRSDGLLEYAAELGVPVVATQGRSWPTPAKGVSTAPKRDPWALASKLAEIAAKLDRPKGSEAEAEGDDAGGPQSIVERLDGLYRRLLGGSAPFAG
jgi:colanic acid/amylovoran biosynthesis glycosyltransferase